jgi:drug/metabolite transporter (DMT)-like permease
MGSIALGPGGGLAREAASPIVDPGVAVDIPISAGAWLSAVASGIVYYALAYVFYIGALRRVPAARAASAFYLIPVFGVAGGRAFLGEQLGDAQWIGAAIVLISVISIARLTPEQPVREGLTRAAPPRPSR